MIIIYNNDIINKRMFKVVLFALFVIAVVAANETAEDQWKKFKKDHNRNFGAEEDAKRFEIFKKNLEKIEAHNKLYDEGKSTYQMGINDFTDMTEEEFAIRNGLRRPQQ
ncbi:procathepsin L-like [Diorhabda carinulata]|uniref:procathepsin L-like n=1 Tax=Diorhabda sublineata TaxID=1163346 RepID=UPI0024E08525|nr:procathepsin L-like [Diorhabda sublineata]XP_057662172.1 procathepsin L-like [Diorhabda carinulata]